MCATSSKSVYSNKCHVRRSAGYFFGSSSRSPLLLENDAITDHRSRSDGGKWVIVTYLTLDRSCYLFNDILAELNEKFDEIKRA